MKLTLPTFLLSLVAFSAAKSFHLSRRTQCAEASRFGNLQVVPSTLAPGDWFTIHADFACALSYDITPEYIDYFLEVTSGGNSHEGPILMGRREFHQSFNTPPVDTFTAQLPHAFYSSGGTYAIILHTTYSVNGTDGSPYLTVGGTEAPINITGIA